ncbi:glycosyltransferase [bacterium]|nr:MAG: glycosyltransferase [bacterium]
MNIIFFSNPSFFGNQAIAQFTSMPRFTKMLANGMIARGHQVQICTPTAKAFLLPLKPLKKLLGYVDQYILFPIELRRCFDKQAADTIFVFTDQAQGPWVSMFANRPHVVHCHDFLAQNSALGNIPENPTSLSGRIYQSFIRKGIFKSKNFISVSCKTQADLNKILPYKPKSSNVVYNGLNSLYNPYNYIKARTLLGNKTSINLSAGYLLHVGGNLWYKNRIGVIEIYNTFRSTTGLKLPLIMIGGELLQSELQLLDNTSYKSDIHFLTGLEDEYVCLAYAGASVFLFPSLAEGFGWPIAEAMACGCPVITTNEAPMTEVAGKSGFFIPKRPTNQTDVPYWTVKCTEVVSQVLSLTDIERKEIVEAGLFNIRRFDSETALNAIENIYKQIIASDK